MRNQTHDEINRMMRMIYGEDEASGKQETTLPDTEPQPRQEFQEYDVFVEPEEERITFIKKKPVTVDAETSSPLKKEADPPLLSHKVSTQLASLTVIFSLFLLLATLLLQLHTFLNPPITTIYLFPKVKTITTSTVILGSAVSKSLKRNAATATPYGGPSGISSTCGDRYRVLPAISPKRTTTRAHGTEKPRNKADGSRYFVQASPMCLNPIPR